VSAFTIIEGDVTVRSSGGIEMSTEDGTPVVSNARGFIGVGYDGTNTRFIKVDTGGRQLVVGAVAHGAAVTGSPVLVGGSDGVNAYRFLTDGSGRPVIDLGRWFGSAVPTVGQKPMASSIPVTIASDQGPVPVTIGPSNSLTGLIVGLLVLGGGTAGSLNVIRATPYNEQTTGAQRSIASSSASDASAGTGMRTVKITYYDSTCVGPFTETITLNGTTAVATVNTDICFIESMEAVTVGSGGANVGTITLFVNNLGGGGTIGTIGVGNVTAGIGDNRTFWAHHYIQTGKTASLATFVASATLAGLVANANFLLRIRNPTDADSPDIQRSEFIALANPVVRALGIPIKALGPARVTAYGIPASNNTKMYASFDFSEL
jgi:hypothetical protein